MKFSVYKRANDYEVIEWLLHSIPEITPYQKEKIRENEIVRWAPFYFFKPRHKENVKPIWRLTILPFCITILSLFIFAFFKFLIDGKWGYENMDWLGKWGNKLNIKII